MQTPLEFVAKIQSTLTNIASKRGVNRQKLLELLCCCIEGYLQKQSNRILQLENALLLYDVTTTTFLKKKLDDEMVKNVRLKQLKERSETLFREQEAELKRLRAECGKTLPTFMED